MSYSGWRQIFCKNGHYFEVSSICSTIQCDYCGEDAGFINEVDNTNGDEYGIITIEDLKRFIISDERKCLCKDCSTLHMIPNKYRIPTEEEAKYLRCYMENFSYIKIYLSDLLQ